MAIKKKNTAIIVAIIVVVAFVYFVNQPFDIAGAGFMVRSISAQVPITSNDPNLNNKFMLVNIVFSGGNDIINARLDSDDVSAETNGLYSSDSFTITAEAVDQVATYPIRLQTSDPFIYEYRILRGADSGLVSSAQQCSIPSGAETLFNWDSPRGDRFCLVRVNVGRIGVLESAVIDQQIKIRVTAQGETREVILSNSQQSVQLPNGRGFAYLNGNLVTGQQEPEPSNYRPVFFVPRGSWTTTSLSTAEDYRNREVSFSTSNIPNIQGVVRQASQNLGFLATATNVENFFRNSGLCPNTQRQPSQSTNNLFLSQCFTEAISPIQNSYNRVTSEQTPISQTQSISNAGVLQGNIASVRVPLDRRVYNADVTLSLQASWIGITRNVGEPEVVSGSCTDLSSGSQQFIEAVVRNAGEATGSFSVRIEGCPSFSQITQSTSIATRIDPGQQHTFRVEMNTDTANIISSETCRIIAYDVSDPSITDQGSTTCSQTAVQLCTPGTQNIVNNCVTQCRTDGQQFEQQFCCISTPIVVSGSSPNRYECPVGSPVLPPQPPQGECDPILGFIPSFKQGCQNFEEKVAFFAALIIGIIAASVIYIYIPNKKLGLIVSLAIGGGLFALIVNIFV